MVPTTGRIRRVDPHNDGTSLDVPDELSERQSKVSQV